MPAPVPVAELLALVGFLVFEHLTQAIDDACQQNCLRAGRDTPLIGFIVRLVLIFLQFDCLEIDAFEVEVAGQLELDGAVVGHADAIHFETLLQLGHDAFAGAVQVINAVGNRFAIAHKLDILAEGKAVFRERFSIAGQVISEARGQAVLDVADMDGGGLYAANNLD